MLEVKPFEASANIMHVTLYDLNADTSDLPQTVSVTVKATHTASAAVMCGTACENILELKETGLSTGSFTASLSIQRKVSGCAVSSAAICSEIGNDAELTIAYSDTQPAQVVTLTPKVVCNARVLPDTAVSPGRALLITVKDCDMDTTAGSDTMTVSVVSTSGSGIHQVTDTEQVILTETALVSGFSATFTGRILTSPGGYKTSLNTTLNASVIATDGNSILYVRTALNATEPASIISVSYIDVFNSGGSSQTLTVPSKACAAVSLNVSQILRGVKGILTSEGNAAFSTGVLDILVGDEARNSNPVAVDVTEITVLALDGSDVEVVVMTETGNNTSVFTGIIGVDAAATTFGALDGSLGPFRSRVICLLCAPRR